MKKRFNLNKSVILIPIYITAFLILKNLVSILFIANEEYSNISKTIIHLNSDNRELIVLLLEISFFILISFHIKKWTISSTIAILPDSKQNIYKTIFENNCHCTIVLNKYGKVILANPSAKNFINSPKDIIGKSLNIPLITEELVTVDLYNNDLVPIEVNMKMRKTLYNNKTIYITALEDITLYKIAQDHIRESENKVKSLVKSEIHYKTIFDKAPVSIILIDKEGLIIDINPYHINKAGLGDKTRKDYINKNITLLPSIINAGVSKYYKGLLEGKAFDLKDVYFPFTMVEKTGFFNIKGVPLIHGKKVVGGIVIHEDITNFKRAEESLRKSRERYRSVVDTARECIITIDEHGKIVFSNRHVEQYFGYNIFEVLGKSLALLIPEYMSSIERSSIERLISWDREIIWQPIEMIGIHKNGNRVPLELSFGEFVESNKQMFTIIIRDITEKAKSKQDLKESEEKFRSISTTAQDAIIMMNHNGNIYYWNPAAEKIFGYSADEVMNKPIHNTIAPAKYRNAYLEGLKNFYKNGKGPVIGNILELNALKKDGTEFPVELSVSAVMIKDKWHAVGMIRDITERRKSEELVRKLSKSVEYSANTIVITDAKGNIEYVNPKFVHTTGYTMEEAIGKNPSILKSGLTPPEEYKKLWDTINSGREWIGEFRNKKKNGELYWELASISAIRNDDGEITHFIAAKEDITKRREAEEELKKHKEQLENIVEDRTIELQKANEQLKNLVYKEQELSKMKDEFTTNVNHELRTPLTALLITTRFLKKNINRLSDNDIYERLDRINISGDKLLHLVNELLDFSKIEAGMFSCHLSKVMLKDIFEQIKSTFDEMCKTKGLYFNINVIPKNLSITTDEEHLYKITSNLISNAYKFTDKGGIELNGKKENKYITISVKDTGCGVAKENLKKIFSRFTKEKENSKAPGTGIGLHMVKKITERHGGSINAVSKQNEGSTFIVKLPVKSKWLS